MKLSYWLLAIGFWLVPAMSAAGDTDSTTTDSAGVVNRGAAEPGKPGAWWIAAWGAGARHSKFQTRLGFLYRDFYMAGIRFSRELPVSPRFAVDYVIDVVPLIVSTNNPVEYREIFTCSGICALVPDVQMVTATARGFGLSPIGLQIRAFPRSRVQPWVGLSLGAAWYDRPVPDPDEQRLNFMGDLAAGVQVRVGRSSMVAGGVRQHHTSNAGTGRVNPGIDSRILYVGVTRSLRRPQRP